MNNDPGKDLFEFLFKNTQGKSCQEKTVEEKYMPLGQKEAEKIKTAIKARTTHFPKNGGVPVKASVPGYNKIPWSMPTLTLIAQSPDGQLHYAKTMQEKKDFAWSNFEWILACWPGKYSQDIFLVDDMEAFRKALGFKKRSQGVFDENGDEWMDTCNDFPKVPYYRGTDYGYEGFHS